MNDSQALAFLIESNSLDLAIACWLDAHSHSAKTLDENPHADKIAAMPGITRKGCQFY
jgi:hypothetical protein